MIVEDEALFRNLLKTSLMQSKRFEVVADCADGESALELAKSVDFDIALLDIILDGPMHGVELGIRLCEMRPGLGVILLSQHEDPTLLSSIGSDAVAHWSFLSKRYVTNLSVLESAIEGTRAGFVVMDARMRERNDALRWRQRHSLTARQQSILSLIAEGLSNEAIAQRLGVATKTIKNQISQIYQELDIDAGDHEKHPRVQATIAYLQACAGTSMR